MKFLKLLYYNRLVNKANQNLKINVKLNFAFLFIVIILLVFGVHEFLTLNKLQSRDDILNIINDFKVQSSQLDHIIHEDYIILHEIVESKNNNSILEYNLQDEAFQLVYTNYSSLLKTLASHGILDLNTVELDKIEELYVNNYLPAIKEIIVLNKSDNDSLYHIELNKNYKRSENYLINIEDIAIKINRPIEKFVQAYSAQSSIMYKNNKYIVIILLAFGMVAAFIIANFLAFRITDPIIKVKKNLEILGEGNYEINDCFDTIDKDEIGDIIRATNKLGNTMRKIVRFAQDVGNNRLDTQADFNEKGQLGKALLNMRKNLIESTEQNKKQREEEDKRNWIMHGMAKFADILRTNYKDIKDLYFEVIRNIVVYVDANQGGLFVVNDEESEKYLELMASIAYNRRKFHEKRVEFGEGLIGQCALEMDKIMMNELPDGYIEISSGLGQSLPRNLIIFPLIANDELFGIIEMASFKEFSEHELQFLDQVSNSIAGTLSNMKTAHKTAALLEQSKMQAEELAAQEEEMRQNMEELQATQEEATRRQQQYEDLITKAKQREEELLAEIERLKASDN